MSIKVHYAGAVIADREDEGSLSLKTAGKYCVSDIDIEYEGGASRFLLTVEAKDENGEYMTEGGVVIENTQSGATFEGDFNGAPIVTRVEPGYYSITYKDVYSYIAPGSDLIAVVGDRTIEATYETGKTFGVRWVINYEPYSPGAMARFERLGDAEGFEDPVAASTAGGGSSPFDIVAPWKNVTSVNDTDVGEMVRIPKYWWRMTNDGTNLDIEIANYPRQGFMVSPAHADRGDGYGERDYVLVSKYKVDQDKRSAPTKLPITYEGNDGGFEAAKAFMENPEKGVKISDYAMWWTIRLLYLVEYATWIERQAIGTGTPTNVANGTTRDIEYHTGTLGALIQENKVDPGTQQRAMKYREIEGVIGYNEFVDGIHFTPEDEGIAVRLSDTDEWTVITEATTLSAYPAVCVHDYKVVEGLPFPVADGFYQPVQNLKTWTKSSWFTGGDSGTYGQTGTWWRYCYGGMMSMCTKVNWKGSVYQDGDGRAAIRLMKLPV